MPSPSFLNSIAQLGKLDIPYDILIHQNQIHEAIGLVERFKHQIFVLNHLGKPKIGQTIDDAWVQGIQTLGKYENVVCKISGMVTETENFKWQQELFCDYLNIVVEAFGMDRLLFGSDWPVCLVAAEYSDVLNIIKSYFQSFSALEQSKIFGLNAKRIYKL